MTLATAAFKPRWSSETASLTPSRPRARSSRRKAAQPASVSDSAISIPITSRLPDSWTAKATISAFEWTWPRSRTLRCLASSQR